MTTAKKNSKGARKPTKQSAPEWVTETPDPDEYQLIMWDGRAGDACEEVDMTRDEYEALKLHLARMRGYKLPDLEATTEQAR